jgi:release factor glutamine methyltransferase
MNETELLFSEILNCERLSLYLNKDSHLDKEKSALISSALKRRIDREPLQYILGKTEFMGLEFKVDRDVFIPRPETEILVETALRMATGFKPQASSLNILDIGTGSGNIAISLAKFLRGCEIKAVDISGKALKIAKENAQLNNVSINFLESDLFDNYNLQSITYDLIVSNPPYIPTLDINHLQPEIKYEPGIALDGGRDGLDFYRRLIANSVDYLKEDGLLILEMGFNQRASIGNIFQKSGKFEIIEVVKDYNNIERVIVARKIWINSLSRVV